MPLGSTHNRLNPLINKQTLFHKRFESWSAGRVQAVVCRLSYAGCHMQALSRLSYAGFVQAVSRLLPGYFQALSRLSYAGCVQAVICRLCPSCFQAASRLFPGFVQTVSRLFPGCPTPCSLVLGLLLHRPSGTEKGRRSVRVSTVESGSSLGHAHKP